MEWIDYTAIQLTERIDYTANRKDKLQKYLKHNQDRNIIKIETIETIETFETIENPIWKGLEKFKDIEKKSEQSIVSSE